MSTEGALSFGRTQLPDEQRRALTRAIHLEWVTIAFMTTAVAVVYLAMGSSQAMKTAWVEDSLALVPPLAFLVAVRRARRRPDADHPYGFHRSVAIGHLTAAVALLAVASTIGLLVTIAVAGLSGAPGIGAVLIIIGAVLGYAGGLLARR